MKYCCLCYVNEFDAHLHKFDLHLSCCIAESTDPAHIKSNPGTYFTGVNNF